VSSASKNTTPRPRAGLGPATKVRLLGLMLAALATVYTLSALQYGTSIRGGEVEAGVLPLLLGLLLGVLSLALIVSPGEVPADEDAGDRSERRREFAESARFFGAIVGYGAVVTLVGFPLGTGLGVPLLLRFVFGYAWPRAVVAGAAMAGLGYLLFAQLLGVQLP
jgi:hypothetical protein